MTSPTKRSLVHAAVLVGLAVVIGVASIFLDGSGPGALLSGRTHTLLYDVCINIMLGMGLTLILGMTGQFSIGHAGFLAAGAYTAVVLAGKPELLVPQVRFWHELLHLPGGAALVMIFLTACAAGIIVAALLGLIVGLPALRLRGDYLAIATLGFGEIMVVLITNSDYLGGATGADLYGFRSLWLNSGAADAHAAEAAVVREHLYGSRYLVGSGWVLLATLISIVIVRNIKYSTSGRALLAVREDLVASEAVGVPTTRYKVSAFIIGAGLAGLAGGILAHHKSINPVGFNFIRSIEIILIVILGGQGSLTGCFLAAILVTLLPEALRTGLPASWNVDGSILEKWRLVIYAMMIILAMLFRPQGLFGRYEITDVAAWIWKRARGKKGGVGAATTAAAGGAGEAGGSVGAVPITKVSSSQDALLTAQNVVMQFGGLKAVDDFNLTLLPGELVGLIGPNGAGKTTVFNVLTGVYRPTLGDVSVGGESVVRMKPHAISRLGVARTFQNIRLFANLSVIDNVQIAQHAHHQQGMPAAVCRTPGFYREEGISQANARGYLDLFNLGHLAGERANSLSYGDQRRLEIARALATRPRVLLLDEPAAGMNPTEKRELMEMIRRLRTTFGLTILLIEHDMKVVMGVCERIVVLDYGKTIAEGTPEEIRKNPAVIEAYLGASAKQ